MKKPITQYTKGQMKIVGEIDEETGEKTMFDAPGKKAAEPKPKDEKK